LKISHEEILCRNALAQVSGVSAKDCLIGEKVISFLVQDKDVGKAIGKNASNLKKLRQNIKKQIEVYEYCKSFEKFIKKALYNIKFEEINVKETNGKKEVLISLDSENRRKFLNSSARFRRVKEFAKRDYGVENLKIR